MITKLLSALFAAALVATPLALVSAPVQAKTTKQVRDEAKGKAAKDKTAAKSAQRRAASKAKKK